MFDDPDRHLAAVYAEQIVVLDPYLLHRRPLRLRRPEPDVPAAETVEDAYPVRTRADGSPATSRVHLTWIRANGTLTLRYARFSRRRGRYVEKQAFTLHPDSVMTEMPSAEEARELLLHPEQNNLSTRVLHPEDRLVREVVLPLTGRPCAELAVRDHLITKDNEGAVSRFGTAGFGHDLAMIADAVRTAPGGVVDFLLEAAAIYRQVAPDDLHVPRVCRRGVMRPSMALGRSSCPGSCRAPGRGRRSRISPTGRRCARSSANIGPARS